MMLGILFLLIFVNAYLILNKMREKEQLPSLLTEEFAVMDTAHKNGFSMRRLLGVFTPFTKGVVKTIKLQGLSHKLIMAGSPLNVPEFISLEILSTLAFVIAFSIFLKKPDLTLLIVYTLAGFLLPLLWLNGRVRQRHSHIARDLPQVMDLLSLCVGAGLDFMLAIHRVTQEFKKCPLTEELFEVWRQTQMGTPRRDALKNMSKRVGLADISSFVRTLVQADRMGTPMSEALRIQSDEIRTRRFQRGEAQALKAPIKILLPLIFFILPIILVIVGGPILLQFLRGGGLKL